jgi:hypothetical protein
VLFRPNKWPKKGVESLFDTLWQRNAFECQNDFQKEKINEDIVLNRIEKKKSKWIL